MREIPETNSPTIYTQRNIQNNASPDSNLGKHQNAIMFLF